MINNFPQYIHAKDKTVMVIKEKNCNKRNPLI